MNLIEKIFKLKEEDALEQSYNDLETRIKEFRKYIGLRFENFIQDVSQERKKEMSTDKQAKELLLYDDCYIIPKDKLKQFIDNM